MFGRPSASFEFNDPIKFEVSMIRKALGVAAMLLALSNSAHALLLTLEPAVQLAAPGDTVTIGFNGDKVWICDYIMGKVSRVS